MKIFSVTLMATRRERQLLSFVQVSYGAAISIRAETKKQAEEMALESAKKEHFPLLKGFHSHAVVANEIPHDWLIEYAQQYMMPIINKAP